MNKTSKYADFKDIWDLFDILEASFKSKQAKNLDILVEQLYDFIGCKYKIGRKYPSTKMTKLLINKLFCLFIVMAIKHLETSNNEDFQLAKIEEQLYNIGTSLIDEYANNNR